MCPHLPPESYLSGLGEISERYASCFSYGQTALQRIDLLTHDRSGRVGGGTGMGYVSLEIR